MTKKLDVARPRVLRNDAEHDVALAEVERLLALDPRPGTDDFDRLETLSVLIEAYENSRYPMGETSTPQSVVEFMLEQRGMTRADLEESMGGKSRVSEFFGGKRGLSLNQVRALRDFLGIPVELLVGAPGGPVSVPHVTRVSEPRTSGSRAAAGQGKTSKRVGRRSKKTRSS